MAYTVSIVVGKGCTSHNNRTIKNKNLNERSWDPSKKNENITYIDVPIKKKYDEIFSSALKKYNDSQIAKGHSERVIKNYYEKISRSKQEKPYREMIVSIGDMDSLQKGSSDENSARVVLDHFAKTFEERNPNFKLFQCIMHNDETGVPHLHIDFIPVSKNNKRGLETKNSMSGALSQMGFKGRDGFANWRETQLDTIKSLMSEIGLEYTESLKPRLHGSLRKEQYIQYDKDLKKIESIKAELKKVEAKKIEIEDVNIPQKKILGNRVMVDSDNLNLILEQNKTYILHKEELQQLPEMQKQLDERIENVTRLENQSKIKIEQAERELSEKIKKTESELDEKVQKTNFSLEEKEKNYAARSNELENTKREFETEKFIKQIQMKNKLREYNEKSQEADKKIAQANEKIANAETIAEKNIKQKYENQIRTQQNEIQKLNEKLEYDVIQARNDAFQVGFEQAVNDYAEQLNQLKNDNKVLNNQLEVQKNENKIINSELNTTKADLLHANARIENAVKVFEKQKKKLHDLQNEKEKLSADFKKQLLEKDNIIQDLKNKLQNAFVKIKDLAKSISSLYYDDDFKQNLNLRGKFVLEAIDRNVTRFLENHGKHDLAEIVRTKTGLSEDIENDFLKIRKEHNRTQGISR